MVVQVSIWDQTVGYIYWDKRHKVAQFEYEPQFLQTHLDLSPLNMSIHSVRSQKQLPWTGYTDPLYQGLPPMIADSLPDRWGQSLFKAWLRDQGISTRNINPVHHLSFIGTRAMGALVYQPSSTTSFDTGLDIDVQQLYQFAQQVLQTREAVELTPENAILWQDLLQLGTSPGGRRPKAIVAIEPQSGIVKSGQGTVPDGFQHYLLKYDDQSGYPYAQLEYIYYLMAVDAGIDMMPSHLHTYGSATHFLTQRFDRIGSTRIHTQTLAAMRPYSNSYEDIFEVIQQLQLPDIDRQQQFLRMVFNVLSKMSTIIQRTFHFVCRPMASGVCRPLTTLLTVSTPKHPFTLTANR